MKTACNICNNPTIHKEEEILRGNGVIELEEFDKCPFCRNIVRGSIKPIGAIRFKRR